MCSRGVRDAGYPCPDPREPARVGRSAGALGLTSAPNSLRRILRRRAGLAYPLDGGDAGFRPRERWPPLGDVGTIEHSLGETSLLEPVPLTPRRCRQEARSRER